MKDQLVNPNVFLTIVKPEKHVRYPYTDLGDGRLLADCYQNAIKFVPERKCWYYYRDGVWVQDLGGLRIMEYCKEFADALKAYAKTIEDEDLRTSYTKHVKKWQSRKARETIIKDARSIRPVSITEFDCDPNVINCKNGTLHLDTMKFAPHRPEDLLTKRVPVVYNPTAKCDRFDRFIYEIMSGDAEKARFLQKAMGYALSGNTRHECMFILHGATTRNGKGTLCESILHVMGSYGCSANPDILAAKSYLNSHAPSEDVARLAGIRYVNISEPDEGMVLNSALIKRMTGNDTLNARFLHENSFDYQPQFKVFINTNHLPIVTDMSIFMSRRLLVIPFCTHFAEHEQDDRLKELFRQPANQSAILNWLIGGYKMLQEEGLQPPTSVLIATGIYQENSDNITQFVRDQLIEIPGAEVRTSEVYARYRRWCENNAIAPETNCDFNASLRRIADITRKRPKAGGGMTTMLLGYQLLPVESLQE
ncbi:MAG: DNA primase [Oscillospiraceae bacterium]|nr:DNA primase [Oscillospiraceae bacterium]